MENSIAIIKNTKLRKTKMQQQQQQVV